MQSRLNDIQNLFKSLKDNPTLEPSFLEALSNIEITAKEDFTEDDWRSLSSYQNYAALIYKGAKEENPWYAKAITSLNHIKDFKDSDWRLLAANYNHLGLNSKVPKLQLELYEKAAASLGNVPIENLTLDDWRQLKKYQANIAMNTDDDQQKLAWYQKSMASCSHIPEFNSDDWTDLAQIQNQIGACKKPLERTWFENAISSLLHVKKDFTYEHWKKLAIYQHNIGAAASDNKESLTFAEQAISTLISHVPEKYFESNDWWHLAIFQQSAALSCIENKKKIGWFEKFMASLQRIPEKDFTQNHLRTLSKGKRNYALACKANNDWVKAEDLLNSSLDSFVKLMTKEQNDYKTIVFIYDELKELSLQNTPHQQLFSFAKNIFLGEALEFNNAFLKYYRETLNRSFDFREQSLRRNLLQLMQLIGAGVTQPTFPNKTLVRWLENSSNRQQFDKILKEIDEAYTPLALLNMIGESPNFPVALVTKLTELENLIEALQKENKTIKEENKQLKGLFQNATSSIYQSHLPIFNNTVDPNLNNQAQPEDNINSGLSFRRINL
jgi:hypothetical protein